MRLTFDATRQRYWLESTYAEKDVPKAVRFRWDPQARQWWTSDPEIAAALAAHADETCRDRLAALVAQRAETRAASRAVSADVEIPVKDGLAYLPFQKAGIAYMAARPATLLADSMGLGKTVQVLGLVNYDPTIQRVLVICPATLKLMWAREARRWLVRPTTIGIAESGYWPRSDWVIVNYDVLHRHKARIQGTEWDLLVSDEAHYLKTPTARRTQMVFGTDGRTARKIQAGEKKGEIVGPIRARRRLLLTGTPIVNRPVELWPLISYLDPDTWTSFWTYAMRYTGAHQNKGGWDFSGASNLPELQDRLRSTIMVRRLKAEVLTELPAKRRQIITLAPNGAAGAVAREQAVWRAHDERLEELRFAVELSKASEDPADYENAVLALRDAERVAFTEISRVRHETALAKVEHVIAHLEDVLESEGKVVVWGHHRDVIEALRRGVAAHGVVVITGETPQADRQAAVDRFQQDPTCRVFIGSITAAGVGITLTAASHAIFSELDWTPGNLTQAEDRLHRIGARGSVLIQHIVLDGSLDQRMAEILVEKQRVIEAALDKAAPTPVQAALEAIPVAANDEAASRTAKQEQIAKVAETLTPEQITAIHRGLQMLAGRCDGAQALDDAGFSKLDTRIGHSLADAPRLTPKQAALGRTLITRYRRQLPADLLVVALAS